MTRKRIASRTVTKQLPFPPQHGGRRRGAGRKPNGPHALVGHRPRQPMSRHQPVLVTVKLREHLPRLRRTGEFDALRAAFGAGMNRFGFRLAHFAVLNDHLHLIVEAESRDALRAGLQGLLIRVARALNRCWQRRGKVFADRYHDRVLRSPREVRNALVYVLGNARKHAAMGRMVQVTAPVDRFSSAPWFDGYADADASTIRSGRHEAPPTMPPRTWLLRSGWRRHGLLRVDELPRTG